MADVSGDGGGTIHYDEQIRKAIQWIDLIMSVCLFSFFYYQKRVKKRCKFEVLYVAGVGSVTDAVKLFGTSYVPATFKIANNGVTFPWSQYCGWLVTCPVLLIHLSNLAGKEVFNVRRMMKILVAYQILMTSGATASMIDNGYRWFFYFNGWFFQIIVFRYAYEIFRESIATMPARAIPLIYRIAAIFYFSWAGFGFFWGLSPAGANVVSKETAKAAYALLDILSKNLYSMHGWYLRWYVLRKADKPTEFVQQEGASEENQPKELKILLVEQDEVFGYFFYNLLVQHSCYVEMAKDATEVMQKTLTVGVQYDMIMINHELARANNYQIMADIRKSLFMLPVIAYGRNIPKEEMDNRNATGIDDFLVAPFPDNEIRNKMTRWSRRASVNPEIMQNMNNIASMANAPAGATGPTGGGKPAATAAPTGGGKPAPTGPGKLAPTPLTFLSGGNPIPSKKAGPTPTFMKPPVYNPNPTFQSILEAKNSKDDERKEKETASLNSKLDLLMQQLVDVKTSTAQANLEMQQRLEKQEQLYQQQTPQPHPQQQYQTPQQQQYQQSPQQQYQQQPQQPSGATWQQQMMPAQQGHQDWGVQAAQPRSGGSNNSPNPNYKVEGEFDYF